MGSSSSVLQHGISGYTQIPYGDFSTKAAADTTPDAFTFTDVTDQELSTTVVSNSITVLGVDAATDIAISVTGGEYSVNGGAFTSSSGNVQLNDTVRARVTTSGSYSTAANAAVTIGGVSDTFTATTEAQVSPTDIDISSTAVSVNGGANAVVGTLTTTDANAADTHTYSLVAGTGDTNNASFNINTDQLRANNATTLGVGTYSVRIQTTDGSSTPYAEAFSIDVVAAGTGSSVFNSFNNFMR